MLPAPHHDKPRRLVTTEMLGQAVVPALPYVNPDDTPLRIDTDYFGRTRDERHPTAGPFEGTASGGVRLQVWPRR